MNLFPKRKIEFEDELGVPKAQPKPGQEELARALEAQKALFEIQQILVRKTLDFEGGDAGIRDDVERLQKSIRACLGDVAEVIEPSAPRTTGVAEVGGGVVTGGNEKSSEGSAVRDEVSPASLGMASTQKISPTERDRIVETDIYDISPKTGDIDLARMTAADEVDIADLAEVAGPSEEDRLAAEQAVGKVAAAPEGPATGRPQRPVVEAEGAGGDEDDEVDLDDLGK